LHGLEAWEGKKEKDIGRGRGGGSEGGREEGSRKVCGLRNPRPRRRAEGF
jgi:hypothetical protein